MNKRKFSIHTFAFLFSVCFLSQTVFAQTIVRRQDFDGNTGWAVTVTPSNVESLTTSGAVNPSNPMAATYGATSAIFASDLFGNDALSMARVVSGKDIAGGNAVLDFSRIGRAAFNNSDLFISFRIAGLGETQTEGLDNADHATVSISLDNGATYSDEARVGGRNNPSPSAGATTGAVWNYNRNAAQQINYDGNNTLENAKVFRPNVGGTSNGAGSLSKLMIRIPQANLAASTGVFLRVTINVNGANELIAVDDFVAYTMAPTAAQVEVNGRVLNSSGRGMAGAFVTVTDASGQPRTSMTSPFGYYRFAELNAGETYVFEARKRGYAFAPQVIFLGENLDELNFFAVGWKNNLRFLNDLETGQR